MFLWDELSTIHSSPPAPVPRPHEALLWEELFHRKDAKLLLPSFCALITASVPCAHGIGKWSLPALERVLLRASRIRERFLAGCWCCRAVPTRIPSFQAHIPIPSGASGGVFPRAGALLVALGWVEPCPKRLEFMAWSGVCSAEIAPERMGTAFLAFPRDLRSLLNLPAAPPLDKAIPPPPQPLLPPPRSSSSPNPNGMGSEGPNELMQFQASGTPGTPSHRLLPAGFQQGWGIPTFSQYPSWWGELVPLTPSQAPHWKIPLSHPFSKALFQVFHRLRSCSMLSLWGGASMDLSSTHQELWAPLLLRHQPSVSVPLRAP